MINILFAVTKLSDNFNGSIKEEDEHANDDRQPSPDGEEEVVIAPKLSAPIEERKDSLSVHVAFVKFHLSRSRKLTYEGPVLDRSRLDQSKHNNLGNACVRFSTIINIGSASFKYDMRRLTVIN